MRKRIYLAVVERLKEITGEIEIKHFDLWNQNVEFIEQDTAFDMPAVFVEFAPILWKTLGNNIQQADIEVRLHVVTEYKGNTSDNSELQSEALVYFDLLDAINRKMFGLKGEGFNAFTRVSSATNHNHEEIIENIEIFTTKVIDR